MAKNKKEYSLVGVDGNAYFIMAYVRRAMRECGKSNDEIESYLKEAKSGDYYNLVAVSAEKIDELNKENGF
jgi:hypothetical protein